MKIILEAKVIFDALYICTISFTSRFAPRMSSNVILLEIFFNNVRTRVN